MKIISWNVNGIRAALKKGFSDYVRAENPDILCLQETKASQGQAIIDLPEYREHWNSAIRKGYSGTAIFTKQTPISVYNDLLVDGKSRLRGVYDGTDSLDINRLINDIEILIKEK